VAVATDQLGPNLVAAALWRLREDDAIEIVHRLGAGVVTLAPAAPQEREAGLERILLRLIKRHRRNPHMALPCGEPAGTAPPRAHAEFPDGLIDCRA